VAVAPSASSAAYSSSNNNNDNDAASAVSEGTGYNSVASMASSYRHHNAGPFMQPQTPAEPQPVLVRDSAHKPKTTGSCKSFLLAPVPVRLGTEVNGAIDYRFLPYFPSVFFSKSDCWLSDWAARMGRRCSRGY